MADTTNNDSDTGSPFQSRKFLIVLLGLGLITGLTIIGIWIPGAASQLPTFIGGVLGALSLYLTGNLVNQHILGRQQVGLASLIKRPGLDMSVNSTAQADPPGIGFTGPDKNKENMS